MAIGKLKSVVAAGRSALDLVWDDGYAARVDLSAVLAKNKGLAGIRGARAFAQVLLSRDGWSVEWPGDIDLGAQQLRRWAEEQAGDIMPTEDFRTWMKAHGLSLTAAAQALGLSRRMVAYYASGERPIPRTVRLATLGWAAEIA